MRYIGAFWRYLVVLAAVLGGSGGPCLLIAAAAALLFLTSQGSELGRGAAELGTSGVAALLFACTIWSLMSWYWARRLLDDRFGERAAWPPVDERRAAPELPAALAAIGLPPGATLPGGHRARLRRWLGFWAVTVPRLCAMAPFLIAGLLLGQGWQEDRVVWLLGATATLVLVGLLLRRPVARRLGWEEARPPLALAGLALSFGTIGLFLAFPLWLGQAFGAVGSVFLFFTGLLPLVATLSFWARRWRVPLLVIVFGILVALPALHPGRHAVRSLPEPTPTGRIGLETAVEDWIANQPDATKSPPLVMVTTAGGGISAAVWTALLLGALADQDPRFAARLFAISGVSGGALGAAVFVAALPPLGTPGAAAQAACRVSPLAGVPRCAVAGIGAAALASDFLGPVFAGYAFGDTFGPALRSLVPDRAAVLERAWEDACIAAGCPAMARSFHALRPSAEWRPALLLNGTQVESGKRVVTSPLAITLRHFDDAFDFFALHGRDIRVSTAALNAARFPYVTPAGLMIAADGTRNGHIADGGYFENYGGETGAEVLRAVRDVLRERAIGIRPVLIEISSDPDLSERDLWRPGEAQAWSLCGAADGAPLPVDVNAPLPATCAERESGAATQLLAPAGALAATRGARGVQTVRRVWRQAAFAEGEAVQFALCAQGEGRPPLGWSLSRATRDGIAADVAALFGDADPRSACVARNRAAMRRLLVLLAS
jgi:hypothetical protein